MKALDALKFTTRVDAHPDGVKRETTWSALAGFEYVGLRIDGRTTFPEDPDDRVKTWSVNLSLRPGAALGVFSTVGKSVIQVEIAVIQAELRAVGNLRSPHIGIGADPEA